MLELAGLRRFRRCIDNAKLEWLIDHI